MAPPRRIRKDIQKLTPQERDTVIRAFQHIISLPADDPNSFFTIAGYHGLPQDYCNHGNILFPTWHRAYLLRVENALRSAPGCENVALPYWNETSQDTAEHGLPTIFTDASYRFVDGTAIPNPLLSYKMPKEVKDPQKGLPDLVTKPKDYLTVRYPYSGLVSGIWKDRTMAHNTEVNLNPPEKVTAILNENIKRWLTAETFKNHEGQTIAAGEGEKFRKCLDAPNYTVFSNTTSASHWNKKKGNSPTEPTVVPLESPHNAMHLAIGGFDVPESESHGNYDVYPFANGDMGENETAAFDPVFYFHHCFIDYMFWRWQDMHNATTELEVIKDIPGSEGKSLDDALAPFKMVDPSTGIERDMTSKDVIDITKLGYAYPAPLSAIVPGPTFVDAPKLSVAGLNRSAIRGSFIVTMWAKGDADTNAPDRLLHVEPVLSRWDVAGCDNCRDHVDVKAYVHLTDFSHEDAKDAEFFAKLHTRENIGGDGMFDGHPIRVELGALTAEA